MLTDLLTGYPQIFAWVFTIAGALMIVWFAVAICGIAVTVGQLIAKPSAARAEFERDYARAAHAAGLELPPDGSSASLPTAPGRPSRGSSRPQEAPAAAQDGPGAILPTARFCRPCQRIRAALGPVCTWVERVTARGGPEPVHKIRRK
jgi:hypothetical protein